MKILFVGDVHVKFDNLENVCRLIEFARQFNDADIAVLAGDVLDTHERVNTQLMNKALELICSFNMTTYVLVGNHDFIDNSQFCSSNHWMTAIKQFGRETYVSRDVGNSVVDKEVIVVDHPLRVADLLMVPYVPPGRFVEALDSFTPSWKEVSCIFAHQEFRGCKMGAITSVAGDVWDETYPLVISGHIHDKQRLQRNVFYPGNVFGTSEIWVFEIVAKGNNVSELSVKLDLVIAKTEYVTVNEINDILPPFNSLIRYSVEGTIPEIAEFKKSERCKQLRTTCKVVFRERKTTDSKDSISSRKTNKIILRNGFERLLNEKIAKSHADLQKDYFVVRPL